MPSEVSADSAGEVSSTGVPGDQPSTADPASAADGEAEGELDMTSRLKAARRRARGDES